MWPFKKKTVTPDTLSMSESERNLQAVLKTMQPWLEANGRTAWIPEIDEAPSSESRSWFGGLPLLRPDETWPLCGACKKPVPFCLQLDGQSMPESDLQIGDGLLQFFYCGNCEVAVGDGVWEPFHKTQLIRIQPNTSTIVPEAPEGVEVLPKQVIREWRSALDFPELEDSESLDLEIDFGADAAVAVLRCRSMGIDLKNLDTMLNKAHADALYSDVLSARAGDKLGGWPRWIQSPESISCTQCGSRMRYVFQIDADCNLEINLGDGGCGHLWQCPAHPEVMAFEWACH